MAIQALVPTLRGGAQLRLTAKGKSKGRDQQESVIIDSSVSGNSGRGKVEKYFFFLKRKKSFYCVLTNKSFLPLISILKLQ